MMKTKKWTIILLGLSLVLASGCSEEKEQQEQTGQELAKPKKVFVSQMLDLSDQILFVDPPSSDEKLSEPGSYLAKLRVSESEYYFVGKEKKDNKVASVFTIDKNQLGRKWEVSEKDKILKTVISFEDQFSSTGCHFENSVPIIKILGHSRLPSVFTVESAIVITEDGLKMQAEDLKDALIRNYFFFYLQKNPDLKEKLVEALGFEAFEKISYPDKLSNRIVTRPELYRPHAIKAKRTDIPDAEVMLWLPVTLIDPKDNQLRDYMMPFSMIEEGKGRISIVENDNLYLKPLAFMKLYLAVPPEKLKSDAFDFKSYSESFFHVEDILCQGFSKMLRNRSDVEDKVVKILKNALR